MRRPPAHVNDFLLEAVHNRIHHMHTQQTPRARDVFVEVSVHVSPPQDTCSEPHKVFWEKDAMDEMKWLASQLPFNVRSQQDLVSLVSGIVRVSSNRAQRLGLS